MKNCLTNFEQQLLFERLIIGVEEPIEIKTLGTFQAKIDSGNGGYNVLHGTDFVVQGNVLNFNTEDKNGEKHSASKQILDTINVHIGGGNIQQRPVIQLDIKFGDEVYENVPFSITDRTDNDEKVLICKDFVKNKLDALIDVGGTNLTEGIGSAIKKGASKIADKAVDTANNFGNEMKNNIAKGKEKVANAANAIVDAPGNMVDKAANAAAHPIDAVKGLGGMIKSGMKKVNKFVDKGAAFVQNGQLELKDNTAIRKKQQAIADYLKNAKKILQTDERIIKDKHLKSNKNSTDKVFISKVLDFSGGTGYKNAIDNAEFIPEECQINKIKNQSHEDPNKKDKDKDKSSDEKQETTNESLNNNTLNKILLYENSLDKFLTLITENSENQEEPQNEEETQNTESQDEEGGEEGGEEIDGEAISQEYDKTMENLEKTNSFAIYTCLSSIKAESIENKDKFIEKFNLKTKAYVDVLSELYSSGSSSAGDSSEDDKEEDNELINNIPDEPSEQSKFLGRIQKQLQKYIDKGAITEEEIGKKYNEFIAKRLNDEVIEDNIKKLKKFTKDLFSDKKSASIFCKLLKNFQDKSDYSAQGLKEIIPSIKQSISPLLKDKENSPLTLFGIYVCLGDKQRTCDLVEMIKNKDTKKESKEDLLDNKEDLPQEESSDDDDLEGVTDEFEETIAKPLFKDFYKRNLRK